MKSSALLGLALYLVSLSRVAQASECTDATAQQCLNHLKTPLPNCHYDFTQQQCLDGAPTDVCQTNTDKHSCQQAGCFFDAYLGTCFASLVQTNSVYQCTYWSSYLEPSGQNNACGFHGCSYSAPSHTCAAITQEGSNAQMDTTSSYASSIRWDTPTMDAGTTLLRMRAYQPKVIDQRDLIAPRHPIFEVLAPTADPGSYSREPAGNCSSYQLSAYTMPAPFTSKLNIDDVFDYYRYNYVNSVHNFNWNATSVIDFSQDAQITTATIIPNGGYSVYGGDVNVMTTNTNVDPGTSVSVGDSLFNFQLDQYYEVHRIRVYYTLDGVGNGLPFQVGAYTTTSIQVGLETVNLNYPSAGLTPGVHFVDVFIQGLWNTNTPSFGFPYASSVTVNAVQFFGVPSASQSLTQPTFASYPVDPSAKDANDALARTFGTPKIGPDNLITSVSYDNSAQENVWDLALDVRQAVKDCALRGATQTRTSNGEQFVIPMSYVESTVRGLYVQTVKVFTVNIVTTGEITIGVTTQYHESGFPIAVSFPQDTCAAGSARMLIKYQYEMHDVYTQDMIVGPRSINDISVLNDPQVSGPLSCYNEILSDFNFVGCDYNNTYTCTFQYSTKSECRPLSSDGQAFNLCSYGPTYGSGYNGGAFPQSYDALHRAAITNYACPSGTTDQSTCELIAQNANGYPSEISSTITSSNYLAEEDTFNPFMVESGLLATPTSALSSLEVLTGFGQQPGTTKMFDGNLFSNQALTVVARLPDNLIDLYDLRIQVQPGNTTFQALDAIGRILGTGDYNGVYNNQGGSTTNPDGSIYFGYPGPYAIDPVPYSGPTTFDIDAVQGGLLFTTKDFYDNGCGPAGTCVKLPATLQDLGCDGFSVPVLQLKDQIPANGYQVSLTYRIGLTRSDGLAPNARLSQSGEARMQQALAQLEAMNGASEEPTFAMDNASKQLSIGLGSRIGRELLQTVSTTPVSSNSVFVGKLYVRISIDANNTISIVPVDGNNSTGTNYIDIYVQPGITFAADSQTQQIFAYTLLPTILSVFLFLIVTHYWTNYKLSQQN